MSVHNILVPNNLDIYANSINGLQLNDNAVTTGTITLSYAPDAFTAPVNYTMVKVGKIVNLFISSLVTHTVVSATGRFSLSYPPNSAPTLTDQMNIALMRVNSIDTVLTNLIGTGTMSFPSPAQTVTATTYILLPQLITYYQS